MQENTRKARPRLELSGIHKAFGPTRALTGVDLVLKPGETHALIGENGAGKSTLMKVISGAHAPDSGTMRLDGESFSPMHPVNARKAGIAMIYQELNLVEDLNAIENITLGVEPAVTGWISRKKQRDLALGAIQKLNYTDLPLNVPAATLTIAQKQIIEIARALVHNPRVLILDEPTSSLTRTDTEKLFQALGELKQSGVSIIYISHFLEECQEICDSYTVLRDGATVESGDMKLASLQGIMKAMVGRDIQDIYPRTPDSQGEPVIELVNLRGQTKPVDVSLTLHKGEILGIAGLIGAGRTEMVRCLFGLDPMRGGTVHLEGQRLAHLSPSRNLQRGLGMVSENRKEEGLLLDRSIADNLTLTRFEPVSRHGFISQRKQSAAARQWMDELQVKAESPGQIISQLSGGNQQKIAIGRILYHGAEILLLDEPTRGIDVGSKAQIYQLMVRLAEEGKSIIFISSYLPELLGICHTIAVMNRGIIAESRPASEWDEHQLIAAAIRAESDTRDLRIPNP